MNKSPLQSWNVYEKGYSDLRLAQACSVEVLPLLSKRLTVIRSDNYDGTGGVCDEVNLLQELADLLIRVVYLAIVVALQLFVWVKLPESG